jgi:hypothetical protein
MYKSFFIILLFFISVSGFSQNSFELFGRVKVDGGNRKAVRIVVTKNGSPYKTYRIDAAGKYSFPLEYNNVYIVSFEKNGFVTKRVEVNTNVPDKVLEDNNFKYKWKVDVGLFKEYEGIDFSFFNQPIQKIFFVENKERFDYDNKYAKQIEKELKRLIAEVEKKKAEEAKQKEIERQKQAELAKQQQSNNKLKPKKESKPNNNYKSNYNKKPYSSNENLVYEKKSYSNDVQISSRTEKDDRKEVVFVSVLYKGVEHVYRKVKWYWGAEYYFKDNENISYSIFFLETHKDSYNY